MFNNQFHKTDYLYTPLFCEENIWQLIYSLSSQECVIHKLWCLFITNPSQKVPLLNQLAAPPNQPVIWDYHVILLAENNHQAFIFDFDTRLGFVTSLEKYLQYTFITANKLPQQLQPYIRKVPAQAYLKQFYSDRSHMKDQIKHSEFPPWPIINANKKEVIQLADYLNIEQTLNDNSQIIKASSIATIAQNLLISQDFPRVIKNTRSLK